MKKLLVTFFISSLIFSCQSDDSSDSFSLNLGKIKHYYIEGHKPRSERTCYFEYDDRGRILYCDLADGPGYAYTEGKYFYDDNDRLEKIISSNYTVTFEYNENNYLINEKFEYLDGRYNENNYLINDNEIIKNSGTDFREKYILDDDRRIIRIYDYHSGRGGYYFDKGYKYDNNGNISETIIPSYDYDQGIIEEKNINHFYDNKLNPFNDVYKDIIKYLGYSQAMGFLYDEHFGSGKTTNNIINTDYGNGIFPRDFYEYKNNRPISVTYSKGFENETKWIIEYY